MINFARLPRLVIIGNAELARNLSALGAKSGFDVVLLERPELINPKNERWPAVLVFPLTMLASVKSQVETQDNPPVLIAVLSAEEDPLVMSTLQQGVDDIVFQTDTPGQIAFAARKAHARLVSQPVKSAAADSKRLHRIQRNFTFEGIIAASADMRSIFEMIEKISEFSTTVLIQGESGTGKELIARAIHNNSPRAKKPFVAINCGAIPENLLESELFGHRKGSFTDATKDKKGLFEEASGGTVLLDEIGELPVHLQVKLLRVLQEGEIRRIGDTTPLEIDVRVLGATLRDLENDVMDGRFRDDLYYRLNVITIRVPPLRERKDDIPLLVDYFLKKNHEKLGLPVYEVDDEVRRALISHDWPGNIRELENCIERAMILCEGDRITRENLPKTVLAERGDSSNVDISGDNLSIKEHVKTLEEALIRRALKKTNGNRTHAAKLLEISHRTLLYKLKEYGID